VVNDDTLFNVMILDQSNGTHFCVSELPKPPLAFDI
jgi:hypothetical protein